MKTLIISFLLIATNANAGNVYVVDYKPEADVKVYVTKNKFEANLWVYVSNYKPDAKNKDEIWYYENYKFGEGTHKIIFVNYKPDANLIVYFVDHKFSAKWNIPNQFVGRLR